MVKGIGPHFAKKLVRAFGEQVSGRLALNPHEVKCYAYSSG